MSDNGDNNEELYDEFGNYIGPDLDSSDDDDDSSSNSQEQNIPDDASDVSVEDVAMIVERSPEYESAEPLNAIVLHEDKEVYPSAADVYGEDVRTAVLDEDVMDINDPIIAPVSNSSQSKLQQHFASSTTFEKAAKSRSDNDNNNQDGTVPSEDEWIYTNDYLGVHLQNPTTQTRRGVAIVGHFHHGKTTLIDLLLESTLQSQSWGPRASLNDHNSGPRYTDTTRAEQERQMSLQSTPMTTLLSDTRGKSYAVTVMDCPGHVNFHDESVAAMRLMDGVVVVIDVVEGVRLHTQMLLKQAVSEGLPISIVLSKMDRMIVETKLPPRDAYFQLQNILDNANNIVQKASMGRYPPLTPERGNVAFASGQHGWLFTLSSFAQVYAEQYGDSLGKSLSADELASRLWGDVYVDPKNGQFYRSASACPTPNVARTFVTLILEPIYKIYAACLGENVTDIEQQVLRPIGVFLSKDELRASARPLLRSALRKFLCTATAGFVDMIVRHVPCPKDAAYGKLHRNYTGAIDKSSPLIQSILQCDPSGPCVIHVTKLYAREAESLDALGRIYSGTLRPAESVQVLGPNYSPASPHEDSATNIVEAICIPQGRKRIALQRATAGNWVLIQGVDATIIKSATLVKTNGSKQPEDEVEWSIFKPLSFPQVGYESVVKIALEPVNPAELPKMVQGLRRISQVYPMARTKVEESGEHVLLGTGELYLDCILHDLRHLYGDVEVQVADPIVTFRETVIESSSVKCYAETTNHRNKLTFLAEPLDDGLAEQLESGCILPSWDQKKRGRYFQTKYEWDLLSARSVWAFGDSPTHGTNILLDDTLPSEVDKALLNTCKSTIVQGFQWASREGPLCEEPVRGTKIKILDAVLADKPVHRGGGQIIPTARRVVHSSILTATPRLLEPVYQLEIQCPSRLVDAIQPVLAKRRGHVIQDSPIPGSIFCAIKGFLPVLDSFGFETDLRTYTQGQAMVHSVMDHWSVVPGDPLDRSIVLHPLEPSPTQHLARELLVKTRRRKGLSEDVIISKFFDEGMKASIFDGLGGNQ